MMDRSKFVNLKFSFRNDSACSCVSNTRGDTMYSPTANVNLSSSFSLIVLTCTTSCLLAHLNRLARALMRSCGKVLNGLQGAVLKGLE